MSYQNEGAPAAGNGRGAANSGRRWHVDHASAEPLLQRLDGVQKSGNGWRARCPACDGRSRKLSIAETGDMVLMHCFGGCRAVEVLGAIGLTWADIMPPRNWPASPEERRHARRAIREAGWASALAVLALEAKVALIAARQLSSRWYLSIEDDARLAQAVERIDNACGALVEAATWRPAVRS